MALKLFNTLARKSEEFVPLRPGEVGMYVCGVTVYDLCHIGHARSAIVFDVIRRYLAWKGYRVRFVKNFTDVDDKIIKRAGEEGVPPQELSERYIAEYRSDMAALGVLPADVEPRATAHISQMITLVERLVAGGFAYVVDGDVYFEVRRFRRYGRLSGKSLEEQRAGARVEVDERKREALDFALWKSAKPGELAWESPWGPGRPGWHIECSAMSMHYLGESFDIHGGGEDLVFPHHENEIAQSEACTSQRFVRFWIHNAMVNMGEEKMSKSLGNTLLIKDLVRRHDPEALRLYLLGTHYRHPVDFAEERVRESARALLRFGNLLEEARRLAATRPGASMDDRSLPEDVAVARRRFEAAMDDDFNTAQAVAVLFDLAHSLQNLRGKVERGEVAAGLFLQGVRELAGLGRVVGLFQREEKPSQALHPDLSGRIQALVEARAQARARRDWALADRLRDDLGRLGVIVEDRPEGTIWKLKP